MSDFSVGPYSIRFSNPLVSARDDNRYSKINSVGKYDAFELFKKFMESHQTEFINITETKTVFIFKDLHIDSNARTLSGLFCVGNYGSLADILNTESGKVDFKKATKHAEIINYYFDMYLPVNADEGVVLLQTIRGNGVKTLFHKLFANHVDKNCKHNLQMNPLAYEKAFETWKDAVARDITLVKFNPVKDIADSLNKLGHNEAQSNLVIKVGKKGKGGLGTLKDFCDPNSEASRVIEVLNAECAYVKATFVDGNNRTRTLHISHAKTHPICEIDVPDSVSVIDGNVELASMRKWCREVMDGFTKKIIRN